MLAIFLSILYIVFCIVVGNIMNDSELRGISIYGFLLLVGAIAQYRSDRHDKR